MLKTTFVGFLLVPVIFLSQSNKAEAIEISRLVETDLAYSQLLVVTPIEVQDLKHEAETEPVEPEAPTEVKYAVLDDDSLSKIAAKHDTTWQRIFDKNTDIDDPNVITVGQILIIPTADEILTERPLSEKAPQPAATAPAKRATSIRQAAAWSMGTGSNAGNRYAPGYCTWYVKNKRPSLPNNLGNASTWVSRAAAQGMTTGAIPRAGAVGQRGMHVVYVESVNADGSVNISEMNNVGLYVITRRTLPASYFTYIY